MYDVKDIIWKPVVGFEGRYEVSNTGLVRSLWLRKSPRPEPLILKAGRASNGYWTVALGRGNSRCIHELVLEAFVGPRPPGYDARHKDGGRTINHVDNLHWGTRGDNIRDAIAHGSWHSEKRKAGRRSEANLASLARARLIRHGKL